MSNATAAPWAGFVRSYSTRQDYEDKPPVGVPLHRTRLSPLAAASLEYSGRSESSAVSSLGINLWAHAFDMKIAAYETLARLSGQYGAPTDVAKVAFGRILEAFVLDGGPAPQPTLTTDGGVEVRWRVNGAKLLAVAEADGACYFYGVDADGDERIDAEVAAGQIIDTSDVHEIRALLESMGEQLRKRQAVPA